MGGRPEDAPDRVAFASGWRNAAPAAWPAARAASLGGSGAAGAAGPVPHPNRRPIRHSGLAYPAWTPPRRPRIRIDQGWPGRSRRRVSTTSSPPIAPTPASPAGRDACRRAFTRRAVIRHRNLVISLPPRYPLAWGIDRILSPVAGFAPCPLRFAIAAAATTTGLGIALRDVRRFDETIQAHQWDIAICEELGDEPPAHPTPERRRLAGVGRAGPSLGTRPGRMWPSQLGELGHPAGRRRFRGDLQPAETHGQYVITRCITYTTAASCFGYENSRPWR